MNSQQKTLYLKALLALATVAEPAPRKTPTTPRKGPTSAPSGENVRVLKARTA